MAMDPCVFIIALQQKLKLPQTWQTIAKKKGQPPRGYKKISYSTPLSMKFILLINVKMPTIVGISTFISRIYTTAEGFEARKVFYFSQFYHL